jgi:Domain of unknown function (DUF4062)
MRAGDVGQGMTESVRVFLSAVSDEFRAYRDQLRGDLTRHNVEVKVQEDFKDLGGVTLEKLDEYIKRCDAVVHLAGDMTGAAARELSTKAILGRYSDLPQKLPPLGEALGEGVPISYTQWEAWLALYHGKVLLIAQADKDAPRGPAYAATDSSRAAQKDRLARLRRVERYPGSSTFTSPDNLAKQIAYTTILDLLAKTRAEAPPRKPRNLPFASLGTLFKGRDKFLKNYMILFRKRETVMRRRSLARPSTASAASARRGSPSNTRGVMKEIIRPCFSFRPRRPNGLPPASPLLRVPIFLICPRRKRARIW